ncbi:unnamed protein product, partial [Effrenium voratum]
DSACSASGEPIPPEPGASWARVLEQMTRCITGFYEGRYVEVRWDPADFWHYWQMPGDMQIPARFGLCIPKGRCKEWAVKWLLAPLLWVYKHNDGPDKVNHHEVFHRAELLARSTRPPGRPTLVQGTLHKEQIYDRAMRELEQAVDRTSKTSGLLCIVGHLRSFGEEVVHQSLRKNVIDALGFSEQRTVLVTEFGRHTPQEEQSQNPWRSWAEMAPALEAVAPDVVVNVPVQVEG